MIELSSKPTTLREEIDRYVINKAKIVKIVDGYEVVNYDRTVMYNTEVEVTVVWDCCDGNGLTTDEEYSFKGKYPDWLIHVNSRFYPHVAECENWEKIEDGVYEVIYEDWC